jgi:hypothetical protein
MAFVIADRVRETTSTTGTGALTLGGPFSGFQGFSVIGDGNNTYYAISDPNTGAWEVGIGTYTASGNTLSRDAVLSSSNSGSPVTFVAGTKDVICTQPSERNVYAVGTDVVASNNAKVPNTLLANSSVTLGSTNVALGATATTLSGLTSVDSTNFTGALDGVVGGVTPAAASVTTLTASQDSSFTSTGAVTIPVGTTAERPAAAVGKIRWNTTLDQYEGYDGTNWTLLGGAVISNDTATATNVFPVFAGVTSGNVSTLFTGDAKLLYKPSTGELQSTALVASNGLVVNSATVTANYTIATGNNASSAGPVTVADGVSVTVSDGSRWVVL